MNIPTGIFYKKICRDNDLCEPDECNLLNESEEEDCGQNDELEDEIITNKASQIEPLQEILSEALGKQLHNTFFLKKIHLFLFKNDLKFFYYLCKLHPLIVSFRKSKK